ncbi:glycosyltransferase family 2 protein [Thermothelomyces heterothallicus CBS 202.75]|uniref:glycosyltransferase family 2 protein n=1 Tax=Thermothelomyces heterothallicus CBS 202.75 TaxID=1149848 RepID=UPI00374446F8
MVCRALANVAMMLATVAALHCLITWLAAADSHLYWFFALFVWRYLRFLVNLAAFWLYTPAPRPVKPTYTPPDVTVILPTIDPQGENFLETLKSCADNGPAKIIVVTAGDELFSKASALVGTFTSAYPDVEFVVDRTQVASKRAQVALAAPQVETDITVLLDDHVFWGPRYLESLLCAFEDRAVGLVGTNKRVRRHRGLGLWGRVWNMLGATYLCRHNFEIRATNTVDGGVFVVSGRTCGIRTEILRHPDFLPGYTNERFFFGLFGPLNADDDNYVTRFVVRHGWKIKIQYTEEAVMHTSVGVDKPVATKFLGQCRRWVRTTWRSNLCSLLTDRSVWALQPYCVYAVYLTSLTNFAALTDGLLVYLLAHSSAYSAGTLAGLVSWILLTKTVKVFDYFRRHPRDVVLFPAYLAFAYSHGLIKFWALLTFWDCTWSGRRLDRIGVDGHNKTARGGGRDDEDQDDDDDDDTRQTPDHPHLATLRSIRDRIAGLHEQHVRHIAEYQRPLLAELQHLRESFRDLRGDHDAVVENQDAIWTELHKVEAQAKDLAAGHIPTTVAESDILKAITGVKDAVAGVEGRWKDWASELAKKASASP